MAKYQGWRRWRSTPPPSLKSPAVSSIRTMSSSMTARPRLPRPAAPMRASTPGWAMRSPITRSRATPSSRCRSSPKAAHLATPPPRRWTPSPISPTATRSARFASATSRTWRCRTLRSATCRTCGARSTRHRRGNAQCRTGLRYHLLPRPRLLQPRQCAFDSRSPRKSPGGFSKLDLQRDLGRLHINISGCINACGHHHVGHIGILGVEKNGEEFYQITLGGKADERRQTRHADRPGCALCEGRRRRGRHRRSLSRIAGAAGRIVHRHRQAYSASSHLGSASMPLVENGRIVEDRYVRVADDAPIPDRVPVIVPANRFLADAPRAYSP